MKEHWTAVKHILMKGTSNYGLTYLRNDIDGALTRYSDANWTGDVNNCKSTSVYLFMMSGAAVSRKSRRQTCVALSTVEAEYIALADDTQEATWMTQVLEDLHNSQTELTVVCKDNQLAICIASIKARPNILILSIIMFKRKLWTPLSSYNIAQRVT